MSFLTDILDAVNELEPPTSFWYWAALSAISAVVKDNIWIERGGDYYKLYPNIYVMLHADSGLKKGPPVSFAKDLVSKVNTTKIISGRSSIQGIMKKLGEFKTEPGGKINKRSTAFIVSSELSSSLVEDKAAADILTDLYDRNYNENEWASLLKQEEFKLVKPTITMLTATNESHSEEFFSKKDVQGGYFARTFIIHETKRHTINSLVMPLKHELDRPKLVEYLKVLSNLSGAFKPLAWMENGKEVWTESGTIYHEWYHEFTNNIDRYDIKDDTGTLNRFGDSVLKVAMLLSLSKTPNLEIDKESMNEAIIQCEKLVGNVRKATMGKKGKAANAILKTMILQDLLNREGHTISRTQLTKKYWSHYSNVEELDAIMLSFDTNGMIKTENQGNQIIYKMPESYVVELSEYLKGKNEGQKTR